MPIVAPTIPGAAKGGGLQCLVKADFKFYLSPINILQWCFSRWWGYKAGGLADDLASPGGLALPPAGGAFSSLWLRWVGTLLPGKFLLLSLPPPPRTPTGLPSI